MPDLIIETVYHSDPGVPLITCAICFCAVVERFWDKHVDMHQTKGELPNG